MFFILSKTLDVLTTPSKLVTILLVAGLALLLTRFARAGRRLLVAGLAVTVILGLLPAGMVLELILEQRFPPWMPTGTPPDGIVILGGAIDPEGSAARGHVSLNSSAERVTEVASLARRFPNARIVFSGGSANLIFDGPPEAAFVLDLFESFGIPRSRVQLEQRSRNTFENARFSKALIDPKPGERWLLLTSAAHMPRAIGAFRKAGFAVEAYPVDWRMRGWVDVWETPPWPISGLRAADGALKEWIGLAAYWFAGYSSELFPGPAPIPVSVTAPADRRP